MAGSYAVSLLWVAGTPVAILFIVLALAVVWRTNDNRYCVNVFVTSLLLARLGHVTTALPISAAMTFHQIWSQGTCHAVTWIWSSFSIADIAFVLFFLVYHSMCLSSCCSPSKVFVVLITGMLWILCLVAGGYTFLLFHLYVKQMDNQLCSFGIYANVDSGPFYTPRLVTAGAILVLFVLLMISILTATDCHVRYLSRKLKQCKRTREKKYLQAKLDSENDEISATISEMKITSTIALCCTILTIVCNLLIQALVTGFEVITSLEPTTIEALLFGGSLVSALLLPAVLCLMTGGYRQATLDIVCFKAGRSRVQPGTVKDGEFVEVVSEQRNDIIQEVDQTVTSSTDVAAEVRNGDVCNADVTVENVEVHMEEPAENNANGEREPNTEVDTLPVIVAAAKNNNNTVEITEERNNEVELNGRINGSTRRSSSSREDREFCASCQKPRRVKSTLEHRDWKKMLASSTLPAMAVVNPHMEEPCLQERSDSNSTVDRIRQRRRHSRWKNRRKSSTSTYLCTNYHHDTLDDEGHYTEGDIEEVLDNYSFGSFDSFTDDDDYDDASVEEMRDDIVGEKTDEHQSERDFTADCRRGMYRDSHGISNPKRQLNRQHKYVQDLEIENGNVFNRNNPKYRYVNEDVYLQFRANSTTDDAQLPNGRDSISSDQDTVPQGLISNRSTSLESTRSEGAPVTVLPTPSLNRPLDTSMALVVNTQELLPYINAASTGGVYKNGAIKNSTADNLMKRHWKASLLAISVVDLLNSKSEGSAVLDNGGRLVGQSRQGIYLTQQPEIVEYV